MDNVTVRKKIGRSNSEINLSTLNHSDVELNSTFLDTTMISLHNVSQNSCNDDLYCELQSMKEKIRSADQEIDNLHSENSKLKQTIQEQTIQIQLLKKLAQEYPYNKNENDICTNKTPIGKRLLSLKIKTPRLSPVLSAKSTHTNLYCTPIRQRFLESSITKHTTHEGSTTQEDDIARTSSITNNINTEINVSCSHYTQKVIKHRVIILGDNQGRYVRERLQNLLGLEYEVTSFIKPNATLKQVVSSMKSDIQSLTKNDFVILLAGSSDRNPYDFSSNLEGWLSTVTNTNIIAGEIPRNMYLHEKKLNYELKFICSKYDNVIYTDLNYSRIIPRLNMFSLHLARSLLKDILHVSYKIRMDKYIQSCKLQKNKNCKNVSTQTVDETTTSNRLVCHVCSKNIGLNIDINSDSNDVISNNINNNNLFRV